MNLNVSKLFSILLGALICIAGGYVIGVSSVQLKGRPNELLERTERFQAEDLTCVDPLEPALMRRNGDVFVVVPSKNRYAIFGLNVEEGQVPECTWTGADITSDLKNGCNNKSLGITNDGSGQKTVK